MENDRHILPFPAFCFCFHKLLFSFFNHCRTLSSCIDKSACGILLSNYAANSALWWFLFSLWYNQLILMGKGSHWYYSSTSHWQQVTITFLPLMETVLRSITYLYFHFDRGYMRIDFSVFYTSGYIDIVQSNWTFTQ